MDEQALARARQRIADLQAGRDPARLDAAVERSRAQIDALARAAQELESALPDRVGAAVQEGLRREVLPVARNLGEIRGLLNQAIRRLDGLEEALAAERSARIDDLSVLVELISAGWQGVDDRLRRLETRPARPVEIVPLVPPVDAADTADAQVAPDAPVAPDAAAGSRAEAA